MKLSFKIIILFTLLLISVNIAVHEAYIYFKSAYTSTRDPRDNINEKLRYDVFTKDIEERLLGYMSGDWRTANGSKIHINLVSQPNQLVINDEIFNILTVDKVDSIFGIVRFTVRDGQLFNQRFQLNKVFDTVGLIVMIFDPETKECHETKKIDPAAPICAKALYLHQDDKPITQR